MKVARFQYEGEISYGVLDTAEDSGRTADGGRGAGIELVELRGDPMVAGYETTGRRIRLEDARLLAPVIPRSKIVCVGKNYVDHVEEMRDETGGDVREFVAYLRAGIAASARKYIDCFGSRN